MFDTRPTQNLLLGRLAWKAGIGLIAVIVAAAAVGADEGRLLDANDTQGPLDVASIHHGHRANDKGRRQLIHTVRLHDAWRVKRVRDRAWIRLFFQLRGHRGNPEERTLLITYEDGKLRAKMYNSLGDPPKFLANVALWRPNRRTVKVAFRRSLLRRRDFGHYRWSARSFIDGKAWCSDRDGCSDSVPDGDGAKRYVTHYI